MTTALSLIDDILLHPAELYEEMKHRDDWSPEVFLDFHFARKGVRARVKRFPYVMYSARGVREPPSTWSPGRFDASVRHVIKYPSEFHTARAYATVIKTRQDWETGGWKRLDQGLAATKYDPSPLQRYISWPARGVYWGLRRPGRVARIGRFLRRILYRVFRPVRQAGK